MDFWNVDGRPPDPVYLSRLLQSPDFHNSKRVEFPPLSDRIGQFERRILSSVSPSSLLSQS